LGVPTRIVLAIPTIDASDPYEHKLVGRLTNHHVRGIIALGVGELSQSWSSHTFNEVFVGGRWRRLNYNVLGQNTLDPQFLGLMTHVATFNDWADGDMAATWGIRQAQCEFTDDLLGGSNPYSTIALSDHFGAHAKIDNPPNPAEFSELTIDAAYWLHEHPADIHMDVADADSAGHIIVRVMEGRAGERSGQYKSFYDRAGKAFLLRSVRGDRPDVPMRAKRGYWAAPEEGVRHFYLHIDPEAFAGMAVDEPYALLALNDHPIYRWKVNAGVTITRSANAAAPGGAGDNAGADKPDAAANAAPPPLPDGLALEDVPAELTIDWIGWSDAENSPTGPLRGIGSVILARVGRSEDFDIHKRFSQIADRRFFLEAEGHVTLKVGCGMGGVTTRDATYIVIELGPGDWRDLVEGVAYSLRPQNSQESSVRWRVDEALRIQR
jgi:hypothetical protein